ncbi:MAG TPA: transmembrane 220 family protein [Acidobacteriota bacterium]|nr:transmembrane 220 family protein [Acidobacteriota bacterium]
MQRTGLYHLGLGVMAAVFLLSAAVQYNDPDPLAWMVIYLAATAVSLAALGAIPVTRVAIAVAAAALIWTATLLPAVARTSLPALFESWEMMSADVEEGREVGGLLLVVGWMAIVACRGRGHRSGTP